YTSKCRSLVPEGAVLGSGSRIPAGVPGSAAALGFFISGTFANTMLSVSTGFTCDQLATFSHAASVGGSSAGPWAPAARLHVTHMATANDAFRIDSPILSATILTATWQRCQIGNY